MNTVTLRADQLLERQRDSLEGMRSLDGLDRWRDALLGDPEPFSAPVSAALNGGYRGSHAAAQSVAVGEPTSTGSWERLLKAQLQLMQLEGELRGDADPDALAIGLIAAFEGGYLLAQTKCDMTSVKIALDMAIARIRAYAQPGVDPGTRQSNELML